MTSLTESGLTFSFPSDWSVLKWDEHKFYAYVSGRGYKGVDFMAIHQGNLYLIEIKSYQDRYLNDDEKPWQRIANHPEDFGEHILNKFEDSIDLINIVHKYFLRKKGYGLWAYFNYPYLHRLFKNKNWAQKDFIFWTQAALLLSARPSRLHLQLWLQPGAELTTRSYQHTLKKVEDWLIHNGKNLHPHSLKIISIPASQKNVAVEKLLF